MPDLIAINGQIIGGVPLPGDNYIKLWENTNPTAAFGAQNITLANDNYDFLMWIIRESVYSNNVSISLIIEKGSDARIQGSIGTSNGVHNYARPIVCVNATTYNINSSYSCIGTGGESVNNNYAIPLAVYGIKKDALATAEGAGGDGHKIEDADGNVLEQQDTLQFKGTIRSTNDTTNGKTVIDDSAVEIDWDDFQAMTEAQRETYLAEHPKVDVVGFPESKDGVDIPFMEKLWENPDPTSAFGAQNITLSSSDYDCLLIFHKIHTTLDNISSCIVEKGKTAHLELAYLPASSNNLYTRDLTYVNDTTLSATACTRFQIGSSQTTSNDNVIPIAIYGIKKTITVGIDAIAEDVSTLASKCIMPDGETTVAEALEDYIVKRETVNGIHCTHWKSGYIEMTGLTIPTTVQGNTITFPYEMADLYYIVTTGSTVTTTNTESARIVCYSKTKTSIKMSYWNSANSNANEINYKIEGYKAIT